MSYGDPELGGPAQYSPGVKTGLETTLFLLRETIMVLRYLDNVHIYLINIPDDGHNRPFQLRSTQQIGGFSNYLDLSLFLSAEQGIRHFILI